MKVTYTSVLETYGCNLDKFFHKENGFVEVHPGNVIMPKKFCEIGDAIINLPVHSDDIWLVSYPRTGSTWASEILWLLCNNLDFAGTQKLQVLRSPLLELSAILYEDHNDWLNQSLATESVDCIRNMASPRFVKTHLPWQLLPTQIEQKKPKMIYIARNPKDLCVSFYYYCQLMHGLTGSFEDFCDIFLDNKAPMGNYWSHLFEFWNRRNEPNMLFLTYEEMKQDLPSVIRKMGDFLDVKHILTEENVNRICDHVKFEKMQQNPAVNLEPVLKMKRAERGVVEEEKEPENGVKFIRKGQIGDWRNYMSPELSDRFDKWTMEATMGTDLRFVYE